MFGLRMSELLLILAVVFILLSASRLPQLGAGLEQCMRGFRRALGGEDERRASSDPSGSSDEGAPRP